MLVEKSTVKRNEKKVVNEEGCYENVIDTNDQSRNKKGGLYRFNDEIKNQGEIQNIGSLFQKKD